jgi:hypothetical protein
MYGSGVIRSIRKDFEHSLEKCIEIRLSDCKQLSIFKRVVGWVLRVFAPLF